MKPTSKEILGAVHISALHTFRPDPRVCSLCGVEVDPNDLATHAYVEHDERDRPTETLVFVGAGTAHGACADRLDAHLRLYSQHPNGGAPGAFPKLCGACTWRDGLRCTHADLKANGGPGLRVQLSGHFPHAIVCTRKGGCFTPAKDALACDGQRLPGEP